MFEKSCPKSVPGRANTEADLELLRHPRWSNSAWNWSDTVFNIKSKWSMSSSSNFLSF